MGELEKISWIGCGRVGRVLARALKDAGYSIGVVACRELKNAQKAVQFIGAGEPSTDVISAVESGTVTFLTTNDDAIESVVHEIDKNGPDQLKGLYFFHTSGSIPSTVFEPLQKKNAEAASIHPLQVFADPNKALETLPGIYYAIEGADRAMSLAVQMVDRLQGKLLLIPTGRKALYHAAGVFAANYLTVLVHLAVSIMEEIGETPEEAYEAFLPLMVSALQNIEEFGVGASLTGPIVRGDEKTIQLHLQELEKLRPDLSLVYKVLGLEAVDLALRNGSITREKSERLRKLLKTQFVS
jgi:predicted short-subunit dehydrogenase-like oxidoreductase (DUF2520 family)